MTGSSVMASFHKGNGILAILAAAIFVAGLLAGRRGQSIHAACTAPPIAWAIGSGSPGVELRLEEDDLHALGPGLLIKARELPRRGRLALGLHRLLPQAVGWAK